MLLEDICDIYSGYAIKEFNEDKLGIPVIKISNILKDGTVELNECQYTIEKIDQKYHSQYDDIYIALSGATTGKIGILKSYDKFIINQRVGIVRKKENNIPIDFIKYFLFYYTGRIFKEASGCAQPNISPKQIGKYILPRLDGDNVKFIVEMLESLTNIIKKRKEQLNYLDELRRARFVEMFGDINANDKNWDCEPLKNLCTIVRGGSPRPIGQFLGGDVPWIKISDATDGDNIYLNSTKEHIIQEGVKRSRMVKSGSLIFANCGVSLGFARIITFDGCIHDGWLAMEDIDLRLDKAFLLQALNQMTEYFREIAPAGTQPNLNTTIMKAYKQVIPPIELQRDFIRFVEQVNKSKVEVQRALDEAQLLFDSLMQKYFG